MRWLARAIGGPRLRFAEAMLMMPMLIWVAVTPTSEAKFAPEAGAGAPGTPGFGTPGGGGRAAPGLAFAGAGWAPAALAGAAAPCGAEPAGLPAAAWFCAAPPAAFCGLTFVFGAAATADPPLRSAAALPAVPPPPQAATATAVPAPITSRRRYVVVRGLVIALLSPPSPASWLRALGSGPSTVARCD